MNLKGFKKISEDEHKAVLRNEKGHSITLAKKGLSKSHLQGLSNLPLYAAEGTEEPIPEPDETPEDLSQDAAQAEQANKTDALVPGIKEAEPSPVAEEQPLPEEPQEPEAPKPVATDALGTQSPLPEDVNQSYQQTMQRGQELQNVIPLTSISQEMQHVGNELATQNIKAKTYSDLLFGTKEKPKSVFGKVGSILGLLIGGAGAGLAHQENALIHMMDNEIKTDLDAQKAEGAKKNTFYNAMVNAIHTQAHSNKAVADITHLAAQDSVTMDALLQAYSRRIAIDRLWNDYIKPMPENSPERARAMDVFGKLVNASNAADLSADALVNGRWQLFQGTSGMMGGPLSRGHGIGQKIEHKDLPVSESLKKWDSGIAQGNIDRLMRNSQLNLPGAPNSQQMNSIMEEAGAIKELRDQRKNYIDSYNKMDQMLFGGAVNKTLRETYQNALNAAMSKLVSGRFVTSEAKQQAQGVFPDWKDFGAKGGKTRQEKFRKGLELFDNLEAGHSTFLDQFGVRTRAPHPILDSVAKHNEAASKHKIGQRGRDKEGNTVEWDGHGWLKVKK